VIPPPLLLAHATHAKQLVAQPDPAGYLPASEGALELPTGILGQQRHRKWAPYHATLSVEVFLEIHVLEVGAPLLLAQHPVVPRCVMRPLRGPLDQVQ